MTATHASNMRPNAELWSILQQDYDVEAFLAACKADHERWPESVSKHIMYAEALGLAGQVAEKRAALDALLARHPDHAEANLSLGLELLHQGRHGEGWPYYARRHALKGVSKALGTLDPARQWQGSLKHGRTILVRREQGIGDTLQFIRFAHNLRGMGMTVMLDVQPALRPFLSGCPGLGTVLVPGLKADIHCWTHMIDLTPRFAPSLDDLDWTGAYLVPEARTAPLAQIARNRGPRIGLAWQGNRSNHNDYARSIPLAALAPLADVQGSCFGLAAPPDATQITEQGFEDWITDLSPVTTPFENLAQAVAQMDVVVTVCTAIAHLAGGMGKPVMLMLSANPDWRWGRTGDRSPWYPSMRLYRQEKLGDWGPVVARVVQDLAAL